MLSRVVKVNADGGAVSLAVEVLKSEGALGQEPVVDGLVADLSLAKVLRTLEVGNRQTPVHWGLDASLEVELVEDAPVDLIDMIKDLGTPVKLIEPLRHAVDARHFLSLIVEPAEEGVLATAPTLDEDAGCEAKRP